MSEPTDEAAPLANEGAEGSNTPKKPGRDPVLVSRDELLERMEAKIAQRRQEENEEFLRSADVNPEAAALAVRMAAEARGATTEAEPVSEETQDPTPVEPIAQPAPKAASPKGEDPLGDYVVRVEGKPMFKTVVDGKEHLVPLDRARQQLQKHLAADIRLQQASERQKQLDAREAQLRKTEQTLQSRSRPPAPAVDDKALDNEAVELVRSLVTEPEDKAAARLAKTLKTIRQATAPAVDLEVIERRAADRAVQVIAERENERALKGGFERFTKDYPDIAADPDLFALADRKTNAIAEEHPEWTPGEVMLEAGKQTREWLKGLGATVPGTKPAAEQPNNRQQRKQGLVPMPRPTTARAPVVQEEGDQSTSDVVAEYRKSRGQGL